MPEPGEHGRHLAVMVGGVIGAVEYQLPERRGERLPAHVRPVRGGGQPGFVQRCKIGLSFGAQRLTALAKRLLQHDRVRLHTSLDPRFSCGIGNVQIVGVDTEKLVDHLWRRHRILATPIKHPEFEGVRITPSVYTTLQEIDYFCDAMEQVIEKGVTV